MRMLIKAVLPLEPFNTLVREGTVGETLNEVLEAIQPEAVYFMEEQGNRCAVLIVNIKEASGIPAVAEPLFLKFSACCEFHPIMLPADLAKAGLEDLGRRWR